MYSENLSTAQDTQLIRTSMFEKRTVVELTENAMTEIDGGTGAVVVAASSGDCALAAKAIHDAYKEISHWF